MPLPSRVLTHRYLAHTEEGDILIRTEAAGETELYTVQQVYQFWLTDGILRGLGPDAPFKYQEMALPGGYESFVFAFNQDTVCPYSFASLGSDWLVIDGVDKKRVPLDTLLPGFDPDATTTSALDREKLKRYEDLMAWHVDKNLFGRTKSREAYGERDRRRQERSRIEAQRGAMRALGEKFDARGRGLMGGGRARSASPAVRKTAAITSKKAGASEQGASSTARARASTTTTAGPSKAPTTRSAAKTAAAPTEGEDISMETPVGEE